MWAPFRILKSVDVRSVSSFDVPGSRLTDTGRRLRTSPVVSPAFGDGSKGESFFWKETRERPRSKDVHAFR